jgi:hypothetical protein
MSRTCFLSCYTASQYWTTPGLRRGRRSARAFRLFAGCSSSRTS